MTNERLTGRQFKRMIVDLLRSPDVKGSLTELKKLPAQRVTNTLFAALCGDDDIKWRAVTAMGLIVTDLAEKDMESARNIMRRLVWSLNEESGGIGWGAPEAMGEIMACHEGLAKEYAPILVSYIRRDGNFLEYELLQRGVIWGIGRLAQVRPQLLQSLGVAHHLFPYLDSGDATLRGLATWALGFLRAKEASLHLQALLVDDAEIKLYGDRRLVGRGVGQLARKALELIDEEDPALSTEQH